MINVLYLPELHEMLAETDAASLRDFCEALHPARTAEFMEGLSAADAWQVLRFTDAVTRAEIFRYFDLDKKIAIIESSDRAEIGSLIADLPPDDRVDLLDDIEPAIVDELMALVPQEERRDIQRLGAYDEETAGGLMTTEFACLPELLNAREALEELGRQAEQLETIYYIYIVDDERHLRGTVSARQLVSNLGKPDVPIGELMERDLVTVDADEDQEAVADRVAHYNLLAIPVVDHEHHILGIITHDDVIDVVREEATEDALRAAAVEPLETGYLDTHLFTLTWHRCIWLVILCVGALLTAFALRSYDADLKTLTWLVLFIPLVISCGGNTGNQSATLIITSLTSGNIKLEDWWRVVWRELLMGIYLGAMLAVIGYAAAYILIDDITIREALVVPITLLAVVMCGAMLGGLLPLLFRRLGLDPAMMSSPFIAGIIDIVGIVIYMTVARVMLPHLLS